jgi:hypothetical protein
MSQNQTFNAIRMRKHEGDGDVSPHRKTRKCALLDFELIQQSREGITHVGHRPRSRGLGASKSEDVGSDDPVAAGEDIHLGLPHGVVEGIGVKQNESRAMALL